MSASTPSNPTHCLSVVTATLHCGVYDAQTGDCGVPEEIQRQKETQGERQQELVFKMGQIPPKLLHSTLMRT